MVKITKRYNVLRPQIDHLQIQSNTMFELFKSSEISIGGSSQTNHSSAFYHLRHKIWRCGDVDFRSICESGLLIFSICM